MLKLVTAKRRIFQVNDDPPVAKSARLTCGLGLKMFRVGPNDIRNK
jgi:hypothetical protein